MDRPSRGGVRSFTKMRRGGAVAPITAIGAPASPSGTFGNLGTIRGAEVSYEAGSGSPKN